MSPTSFLVLTVCRSRDRAYCQDSFSNVANIFHSEISDKCFISILVCFPAKKLKASFIAPLTKSCENNSIKMPALSHRHRAKLELRYCPPEKYDEDDDIISVVINNEKRSKSVPVRSKSLPSLTTPKRRQNTSNIPKGHRKRRERDDKRSTKKKVRFDKIVKKKPIKKWSTKDCQKAWYSEDEMKEIFTDCAVVLKHSITTLPSSLETPTLEHIPLSLNHYSDDNFCARGLEGKVAKEQKRRNEVKQLSREAVFREQERQWQTGIRDEQAISLIYASSARNSAWAARLWGLKDELDVACQT